MQKVMQEKLNKLAIEVWGNTPGYIVKDIKDGDVYDTVIINKTTKKSISIYADDDELIGFFGREYYYDFGLMIEGVARGGYIEDPIEDYYEEMVDNFI